MVNRKVYYTLSYKGQTYIASWKCNRIVLKKDPRTPDDVMKAAFDAGHDVRYCDSFLGIGPKTHEQICRAMCEVHDNNVDAQFDWEAHNTIIVRNSE
jgi:hypothetical protein